MRLLDLQTRYSYGDAIELHEYLNVVDEANRRARERAERARRRSQSTRGRR